MLQIGEWKLESHVLLAPMAGITDYPFRYAFREFGAGLATSEMLTSDMALWHTPKSKTRLPVADEQEPRSTQIAGTDPRQMAEAARFSVARGAQIIDINMGCPAKKVCSRAAGSALLQEPHTVRQILKAVRRAVDVPVTLKTRTGWSRQQRNALDIARMAEDCGLDALTIHGRTRSDAYRGYAEFETLRRIKQAVSMPVLASGDMRNPQDVAFVMEYAGADGVMLGRAAQGAPWIFSQYRTLAGGPQPSLPGYAGKTAAILKHIRHIHDYFGDALGVRVARKHINWYLQNLGLCAAPQKKEILTTAVPSRQIALLEALFVNSPHNDR